MADNFVTNAGSGGATFASDDVAGVHYSISKLAHGALDSATVVSTTSGLPVQQQGNWTIQPLPAGTANIGDVDIASALPAGTNNIGDVDVLSLIPGTSATSLGKARDSALGATDTGVAALGVRDDALTALTEIDGDYTNFRTDSTGAVWVAQSAALPAGTNNIGDVDVLTLPALPAGTNNIGDVDVLTLPALPAGTNNIGDVDVLTLPALAAGTNLVGRVAASDETSTIYQGTTARTPVFAIVDAAASGDNTLVAAQGAGNKIRVHQLYLVSAGTVTVRFESGAAGTALSGQMNLVANTGFVLPYSPIGWFETAANVLLNLELSGAISVDGGFAYTVVT